MPEDTTQFGQDKPLFANQTTSNKPANKQIKPEVNIFPALAERRTAALSMRQPTKLGTQISIFSPVSFEEALEIVECLRARAATTISLENMKKVDASRLVDFVAGASAALDGDFHKLSEQVYLFAPSNIKITAPGKSPKFTGTLDTAALDFLYPSSKDSESGRPASWS